jgi:cbb3-type cytochrome oxidase maturation protein
MSILFVLIIISLFLAAGFLLAFFWATKDGQFEDDYTPSVRMLFDDELTEPQDPPTETNNKSNHKPEETDTKDNSHKND